MKDKKTMSRRMLIRTIVDAGILLALATILSLVKIFELPFGGSVTLFSMLPIAIYSYRYGVGKGIVMAALYGVIQMLLGLNNFSYVKGFGSYIMLALFDYIIAFGCIGLAGMFKKVKNATAIISSGVLSLISVAVFTVTVILASKDAAITEENTTLSADIGNFWWVFATEFGIVLILCIIGLIFKNKVHRSGIVIASGLTVSGILRTICHFISGVTIWRAYANGLSATLYSLYYNLSYMIPELILTVIASIIACSLLDFDAEVMNVRFKNPDKVKMLADIDKEFEEEDKK